MDNPDSVVPLEGFCENCQHFAGRHQELRCHFPNAEGEKPCPCTGLVWRDKMYEMDMNQGAIKEVPHRFVHLRGYFLPLEMLADCDNGKHSWTNSGSGPCSVCYSKPVFVEAEQ